MGQKRIIAACSGQSCNRKWLFCKAQQWCVEQSKTRMEASFCALQDCEDESDNSQAHGPNHCMEGQKACQISPQLSCRGHSGPRCRELVPTEEKEKFDSTS
jgi:hypothetical protein